MIQWWLFGPVVLAVVMFLLMGTIFEHRIEQAWRRLIERRQAQISQLAERSTTEQQPASATTTTRTPVPPKMAPQRNISNVKCTQSSCKIQSYPK
ncbi:hypothetical protein K1T71_010979 [Dendrolimus kikuchii]|uniref:Uncharacterized protein n=1 Tax=Dendrolimus kikuchii TaxID=765133 RepID=A0ACC1CQM2_9NEOP|nr:hypothetical protein K1T71_010979 [Dendrolimus kikuchii]